MDLFFGILRRNDCIILLRISFLSQHNRSEWQTVFIISAAIFFLGNLLFLICGSSEVQPWDAPDFLHKDNVEELVKVSPKSTLKEIFGADDDKNEIKGWAMEKSDDTKPKSKVGKTEQEY